VLSVLGHSVGLRLNANVWTTVLRSLLYITSKFYLETASVSLKDKRHGAVVAVFSESNLIRFYF